MDDAARRRKLPSCPHVDRDDHRCNSRFSLGRIDQAFCVCFGAYHACPMFHEISMEMRRAQMQRPGPMPLITVTAYGKRLPLQATGT